MPSGRGTAMPGHEPEHAGALACRLLAAQTPAAVADLVGTEVARRQGQVEAVLWSTHWPQGIISRPEDAELIDRAVREVSARRGGARPDRRFLLLCDDGDGAVAMLRLNAPLAEDATAGMAAAGTRIAELLRMERLSDSVAQLENAERLQRALYAIADLAGSDLDMPDMLRGLHRIISELMYAENFYIALYDEKRDSLHFAYFADTVDTIGPSLADEVPMARIERGPTWYVVRDRRPLMGTTEQLQQQVSGALALHGAESVDWLGVPMLREGRVTGALVVQSYLEGVRYSSADMSLLAFVAEHVQTALERRTAREETERRVVERTRQLAEANRELSREVAERQRGERLQAALYRIAALTGTDEDQAAFYRHVHGIVGELINARNFYIALLSGDGSQVEFPYAVDERYPGWENRPFGRGLTEFVVLTGRPQVVDQARAVELAARGEIDPAYLDEPAKTWLGAPLYGIDGVMGVVAVQSYTESVTYDERDAELLTFASYQIASSLQRRRASDALKESYLLLEDRVEQRTRELREQIAQRELVEARLQHQVMHDALTDLPNRVYLRDRIERAIAHMRRDPGRSFGLLYIDVDRFKQINDTHGHLAGDAVLREVSHRLEEAVREPDVVARLSGDEFAVMLEQVELPETAAKVAQRIITALREPILVKGLSLRTSASVGIAIGDRRYHDADAILRDADIALYRAKEHGRNRFVLFDEHLHRAAMDVLQLEDELRDGLRTDAFAPWFQPLVSLADARIAGYEALARWQHPQRGVLEAHEFLQVAEDSGLIEQIDWRLFARACEAGHELLDVGQFISINVNTRMFRHRDFDARLLQLVASSGLSPAALRIELTENVLLGDPESIGATLQRLRDAGIDAALDDFGTGVSAFGSVHGFPLRMVKIDRSVVAGLDAEASRSRATAAATIAMAKSLNLDTLAEGVETQAQREALLAMGCRYGQGHLFGRAQPPAHWRQAR